MPTTIASGRSPYHPPTCESTPEGYVFLANGVDPTIRIKRLSDTSTVAGITAPASALTFTFSGSGEIDGEYRAYVRFMDIDEIPSSLSPIPDAVEATDNNMVSYPSVPTSSNSRVTKREIYRTTAGQNTVVYRDVVLNDNTTTTASSTKTDDDLVDTENATYDALPILNHDGTINAYRFEPPPAHKAVIVQHQDRFWYAVDVAYTLGNISVTNGSTTVTGIGTAWTSSMAGRQLYVGQQAGVHEISSVDVTNQTLTLESAYTGNPGIFGYYAIMPHIDERNKIYFSFVSEPESVPSTNSFKIAEISGDEVTGLMPLGQFLFVLMNRHIYRISYSTLPVPSPDGDLAVHKTVSRGCLNQRCWVRVEDIAFMLDREGVHRFEGGHDGGKTEHISEPIQNIFREGLINWTAQKWFFTSHSPTEEVVRFHVCLGGAYLPKHALCYHYRHGAWWIESYPWGFGGYCLALVSDEQRCILGGQHDYHWLQGEGALDSVMFVETGDPTIRGTVDSATFYTITDSSATFPLSGLIGAPLHVLSGRGKGQMRKVVAVNGTTLTVQQPFIEKPDTTSTYQLGGVDWKITSGTYRFTREHQQDDFHHYNRRRIRIFCEPTLNAAQIDMKFFVNHDAEPYDQFENCETSDGVTTFKDEALVAFDTTFEPELPRQGTFSGYHHLDISKNTLDPRYSDNWVTIELSGIQERDATVIFALGVDGAQ